MVEENKSKKIVTFIFLKIIEIGGLFGIVFGPYFLGRLLNRYESTSLVANNWVNGMSNIIMSTLAMAFFVALVIIFYMIIAEFVKINWRWACI